MVNNALLLGVSMDDNEKERDEDEKTSREGMTDWVKIGVILSLVQSYDTDSKVTWRESSKATMIETGLVVAMKLNCNSTNSIIIPLIPYDFLFRTPNWFFMILLLESGYHSTITFVLREASGADFI